MTHPDSYKNIITGRLSLDNWLIRYYSEFYQFLKDHYVDCTTKEALYMFYNNIEEKPLCKACGKPVNFHGYVKGFGEFCSSKCAQNDKEVREKYKKSNIQKYGDNYTEQFIKKGKQTCLKRYGVENISSIPEFREKAKQTCLERYGVNNPMKSNTIQDKSKQTCLERYGNEYYFRSEEYDRKRKECLEKSRKTCLEKYGHEYAIQSEDTKKKLRGTCLERYGVEYMCLSQKAHNSRNSQSKPNENFKDLLIENNIKYEKEKYLCGKSFDFLVNNTLIEINPYPTHNINWNPFGGKMIGKTYHYDKTKLARDNNYRIINIWDWDDKSKIAKSLIKKNKLYARNCTIKRINKKILDEFLNQYHFQNTCRNQSVRLGLYYNNELIQVMSFGKPRYNKKFEYELIRLCTKFEYIIIGGAEKLFNYFIKESNPQSIISYCDNSKFSGNVYNKLGFKLISRGNPSRHWYNSKTKTHITDNLLLKKGFDNIFHTNYGKGSSNEELMRSYGFVEIYDAGQSTYAWYSN